MDRIGFGPNILDTLFTYESYTNKISEFFQKKKKNPRNMFTLGKFYVTNFQILISKSYCF